MSSDGDKVSLDGGQFLFRFRSAKALLDDDHQNGGFQELERQTIYFAQPEALNDPMEGLNDAFWDGDQVLWENLFRHYALSLLWYVYAWFLYEPSEIDQASVSAGLTEADLPTNSLRDIYHEFCLDYCAEIDAAKLAEKLGRRTVPLRRERFTNLLFSIHQPALFHLFRVLKKHSLGTFDFPIERVKVSATDIVDAWEAIALNPPSSSMSVETQLEVMSSIGNRVSHQLDLAALNQLEDTDWARKLIALMTRFPQTYVDAFLRDLHFTPWRVACFSKRCVNASMWGTYGAEHRGAVLVFRTENQDGKRTFCVHGSPGTGARGIELEVRSITYRNQPPPLDCFLRIGRLPMAKLKHAWMTSESGSPSDRLQEVTEEMERWRKDHWEQAFERATWKHTDWAHEDEQRIIVSSVLVDDPAPDPLTYELSQLEGIIFGMRMSDEDKLRIVDVIKKKCRAEGRSDFRFFQAHYSPTKGKMEIVELGLLKLN